MLIPLVNLSNLQGDTCKVKTIHKGFNSAHQVRRVQNAVCSTTHHIQQTVNKA